MNLILEYTCKNLFKIGHQFRKKQGMSCEGACAHAHVRGAVARVRAKSTLKSVQDVRACGSFLGVRCAITLLHTFWNKTDKKWHLFVLKTVLECPFLF